MIEGLRKQSGDLERDRKDADEREQRIVAKENALTKREQDLDQREKGLDQREKELDDREAGKPKPGPIARALNVFRGNNES
jgi:uncharacterized protein (DUF3084 family)